MEPLVTERDFAMLLLSEDDLVALGAMLGLRAQMARALDEDSEPDFVRFDA